jgi:hypothetical protein
MCCIGLVNVSVIVRVFELVKCTYRSLRNQACTETDTQMNYRNTTSTQNTRTRTHPHTPSSCGADECEAWLFLASPLSDLYLQNNQLMDLPSGVFSNLSSLRSLVFLIEWEKTLQNKCVQMSERHRDILIFFWQRLFISYPFLFFVWNLRSIYVSFLCVCITKCFLKCTSCYVPLFMIFDKRNFVFWVCAYFFCLECVYTYKYVFKNMDGLHIFTWCMCVYIKYIFFLLVRFYAYICQLFDLFTDLLDAQTDTFMDVQTDRHIQ